MKEKKADGGRWFCLNIDCGFKVDEGVIEPMTISGVEVKDGYRASVLHQQSHPLADPQVKCIHTPACDSLYYHRERSPTPGADNW